MRFHRTRIRVLAGGAFLAALATARPADAGPNQHRNIVAGGVMMSEAGAVGVRIARWLDPVPLAVGLGLDPAAFGLIPHVQVSIVDLGASARLYAGAAFTYAPVRTLVSERHASALVGTLGVQLWGPSALDPVVWHLSLGLGYEHTLWGRIGRGASQPTGGPIPGVQLGIAW